jgi:hypothetical protein
MFQSLFIRNAAVDALSGQDTQFDLSHVEPTAMLGREVKLEAIDQPSGFIRLKGQIESGRRMSVEIIEYQDDLLRFRMDFIRAAAEVTKRYSNVQFLIVGGGPLRPECERLINENNLNGKLFLLGFRDDVDKILSILTMTAMSSLWEGLPIAFLESMSAGKPIVANNVDGACDVVRDGETGFLVTPHKPLEMAERILTLLNDKALCNKMGYVAQQRSNYFSKQRMLEHVESLYQELHSASQVMV